MDFNGSHSVLEGPLEAWVVVGFIKKKKGFGQQKFAVQPRLLTQQGASAYARNPSCKTKTPALTTAAALTLHGLFSTRFWTAGGGFWGLAWDSGELMGAAG